MFLLDAYKRRMPLYLRAMGAILALTAVVSFVIPQTFTATSSLMPPETKGQGGGLSSLLQGAPIAIGLGASENKASLIFTEILQSRTLIERVIDSLGLRKHPLFEGIDDDDLRKLLKDDITLDTRKTGTIVIEVDVSTGWFPFGDQTTLAAKASADIANACREQLDMINREKTVTQARKARLYIERVMANNRAVIDSLQSTMQEFQQTNKIVALEEQLQAMAENASMVGTELAKAEIELALARQEYQPSSTQVSFLQTKVDRLREQYTAVQSGGIVQSDGFSIPVDRIPALSRTYLNLTRDMKIKEQINAYLESQRMQEMIQEEKDTPTVVALDVAKPPEKRTSPSRLLMLILTWLVVTAGFAVGVPVVDAMRVRA
jgi:tyrosine-protein kinase Etk/Wzc